MATKRSGQSDGSHTIIQGVFLVLAALAGGIVGPWVTGVNRDNDRLRQQQAAWQFSEQLYRQLPGDVDFITRGLRVNKVQGGQVRVLGPAEGDDFLIAISQLKHVATSPGAPSQYSVQFVVSGRMDGSIIRPSETPPVPIVRGTLVGPMNAVSYEFYLYFDDVRIDDVLLTVARRRLGIAGLKLEHFNVPFDSIRISGPRPKAIVTASPNGP
jgi:hypothetical protein